MPRFAILNLFVTSLCLLASLSAGAVGPKLPSPDEVEKQMLSGIADAKKELQRGHFAIAIFGLPSAPEETVRTKILSKYGIIDKIVGDVASLDRQAYVAAYNFVMRSALENKYGGDIWSAIDSQIKVASDPVSYRLVPVQ